MAGNAAHDYAVRDAINQVVDASRKLLDTNSRPVQRDQHPKQHGCLRARFVIGKNLESRYRQGLFQEPRLYEAWIRLSNGAQHDDRKPDAHGMAVKLMGVDGPKVLPARERRQNPGLRAGRQPDLYRAGCARVSPVLGGIAQGRGEGAFAPFPACSAWCWADLLALLTTLFLLSLSPGRFPTFLRLIRFASKRIANPVTTRYWSTTPYRFGDTCMKFSAVPADFPGGPPAEGPIDDSYDALVDFLRPAVATETVAPAGQRELAGLPPRGTGPYAGGARGCLPVSGSALQGRSDDPDRRPDRGVAGRRGPFHTSVGSGFPSKFSIRRAEWHLVKTYRSRPGTPSPPTSRWARSTWSAAKFTRSSATCVTH